VPSSGSITPLPLDPELLGQLLEKVPAGVIEQLTHHWRKQSEALARSEKQMHFVKHITEKLTDLFDFFCSLGLSSFQVRD
jgi:hypothetical protein